MIVAAFSSWICSINVVVLSTWVSDLDCWFEWWWRNWYSWRFGHRHRPCTITFNHDHCGKLSCLFHPRVLEFDLLHCFVSRYYFSGQLFVLVSHRDDRDSCPCEAVSRTISWHDEDERGCLRLLCPCLWRWRSGASDRIPSSGSGSWTRTGGSTLELILCLSPLHQSLQHICQFWMIR